MKHAPRCLIYLCTCYVKDNLFGIKSRTYEEAVKQAEAHGKWWLSLTPEEMHAHIQKTLDFVFQR